MKLYVRFLSGVVILVIGCSVARAQTNSEVNSGVQFNFSTPGARSLALGGAFLGLADDATSAFTNPAGLTVLSKPEVSLEGRRWGFSNKFVFEGRSFGAPTQMGNDTIDGVRFGTSDSNTSGVSFLSFVYPGKSWAVALYLHELANFDASFRTRGPFFTNAEDPTQQARVLPIDAGMSFKIRDVGVSGAYRFSDRFSVGVGLSRYQFTMDSRTSRYLISDFGDPDYSANNVLSFQDQKGDDNSLGASLGFRWAPSDKWSFGGVYRQGPNFDLDTTNTFGPAAGANFSGMVRARQVAEFHVPDVFGLGVAFKPTDAVTVTVDFDRIRYSLLTRKTINIFAAPDDPAPSTPTETAAAKLLKVDDANEIHLGLEYLFLNLRYPIAVRVGAWRDPDHRIRFVGDTNTTSHRGLATRFRAGEDETHYSAGFGWVLGKFQLDAAADFSNPVDTTSLSAVFRF